MQQTFVEVAKEDFIDSSVGSYLSFKRIWDKEGGDADAYEATG